MKKKKSVKPTSVRLDPELQDELDDRCNNLGCSKNKFIEESVKLGLGGSSDFNFGDEEEEEEEPKKIKVEDIEETKPIPEGKITKISYDDGKTWEDVPELKDPKIVEI